MKAKEFDKKFDEGSDITGQLDLGKSKRPLLEAKRVNVDFPVWMIRALDKESSRIGISRQALIKLWVSEQLKKQESKEAA